MKKLIVEIELGNDAFQRSCRTAECKKVFNEAIMKIASGRYAVNDSVKLMDTNGNSCGTMKVVEEACPT